MAGTNIVKSAFVVNRYNPRYDGLGRSSSMTSLLMDDATTFSETIFQRRIVSEKVVASSIDDKIEERRYRGLYRFTTKADLTILVPAIAVSIASGCLIPAFTILLGKIFIWSLFNG